MSPLGRCGRLCLPVADCMKAMGVGRTRFYELLNAGEIEAVKVGRSTRVVAKTVIDWLDRQPRYRDAKGDAPLSLPKPSKNQSNIADVTSAKAAG
jgi:excisionase family DNA binding protein